ncbi:conserved Plasmodium protein, unknown function [Plasmodium knowlesi strain H]|uniref:Uncharacterized protein n=3 Tax=Plasmodium knowlesi TaxID=5850 RepID=A0A5K1VTQ3_PLAKH|nr:conserved Plasmodium protein, unknown function [Plasmodium knowlesi strain H]OTN67415.1 Uncharacterized protein PKNOH_S06415300 [Plasmodium knowlesi]CAA9987427.1 conserved Plasmodium protein, unknown function [Plasmodium knowlesi strain H]SBO23268.1 conserved Plasmodium protein, unknown function [Plasmodium knowlesi strain H]SBO24229.1 conserved Plasmodium protein, unknown function [Plasmodium knowlesi strain H]VVS76901.1 conserved Plasmodium protein, unknown function [Plasmodium knowlesi s|eukprot:XP_002258428.1 hypothetical protein, conserved in Plasmodium species [Plasmodium knowlesi strain H]
MMKITRERKKYRISNPYDEAQKVAIKAKAEEQKKRDPIGQKQRSDEQNEHEQTNAAERFMQIYKDYIETNEEVEKFKKVNEDLQESKKKTSSRKKIKKLNLKLKKNNLIAKLVKNKAIIKADRTIMSLSNKRSEKKILSTQGGKNKSDKVPTRTIPPVIAKVLRGKNLKEKNEMDKVNDKGNAPKEIPSNCLGSKPNGPRVMKTKENVLNQYDDIVKSSGFIQNPLEYARRVIEQRQKQSAKNNPNQKVVKKNMTNKTK